MYTVHPSSVPFCRSPSMFQFMFFFFCFCQNLISGISSAFPAPVAFPCQRLITSLSGIFRALPPLRLAAFLNTVFLCGGNSFIFTAAELSFPNTQCVYLPPTSVDCFTVWIWTRRGNAERFARDPSAGRQHYYWQGWEGPSEKYCVRLIGFPLNKK